MIRRFHVHFDIPVCTYVYGVEKPTANVVDLSQIYSDLQAGRKRSTKMDLTLPNLCSRSNREREHDYFFVTEKETSLYSPRKIRRYFPF